MDWAEAYLNGKLGSVFTAAKKIESQPHGADTGALSEVSRPMAGVFGAEPGWNENFNLLSEKF